MECDASASIEHGMIDIVEFWRAAGPSKWFAKDAAFDAEIRARFLHAHFAAARREHESMLDDADGALALILLLDQVPRNVFRDSAHAFATDSLARAYAQRSIAAGPCCVCSSTCRSSIPRTSPIKTAASRWSKRWAMRTISNAQKRIAM
jgi:uncharacterized protein (DUF924 family)